MTHLSRSSQEPDVARPGGGAVSRYLFAVLGAGIFSGLAATVLLSLLGPASTPQVPSTVHQPEAAASVFLDLPNGADPRELRVTVLQAGRLAKSERGKPIRNLDPAELSVVGIRPGLYAARVTYRGKAAEDLTLQAAAGVRKVLPLSGRKLAGIEYAAGEAADRLHEGDGIPYFRRTVQLDAKLIPAHLQLAAYELVHGSPDVVKAQLNAVRQLDPKNNDAAAVEKLLEMRLSHRR
jgi:hypothetical protein